MGMISTANILVADDDALTRLFLKEMLTIEGYRVVTVENGEAALEVAADRQFDLVLTDLNMDGVGGMEVLATLHRESPSTALIMFTAETSPEVAVEAFHRGAHDFLCKPRGSAQLRESIRTGLVECQRELRRQEWLVQLERYPNSNVEHIRAAVIGHAASLEGNAHAIPSAMSDPGRRAALSG